MKRHIKNSTKLTGVKEIASFVDPGIKHPYDIMIKNGSALNGRAYHGGCGYHSSARPFVVCRIPKDSHYPTELWTYQLGQFKGKRYYLANRVEALVYLLAHELRHLWQSVQKPGGHTLQGVGYVHGAKGKFSEIDTEAYAIYKLRQWRKTQWNAN